MEASQQSATAAERHPCRLPGLTPGQALGQQIVHALRSEQSSEAIASLALEPNFGALLPELVNLSAVPQDPNHHPEGDVWRHTLLVIDETRKLIDDPRFTEHERTALLVGVLLHDVGKGVEGGTQITPDGHGG